MKKIVFVLSLLLTAPLAGCLDSSDDRPVVRVLTYDITAFSEEMFSTFTNETGYEIELILADDAGGILQRLLQTQDAPQFDLAIGLDNTYLQTALDADLFVEHDANVSGISSTALEPYNGPFAVPFDRGDVCLNYDETRVDGENLTAPTSLWNLTEPAWEGLVAYPSPLTSSPGRAFMTATVDYFENDDDNATDAFDWWKAVAENGAIFTSGWTEAYEIHYSGGYGSYYDGHIGDAAMTVSYCHSPGVEAFFGENYTISTSLTLPRSSFHQVEYAAVVNGASEVDGANAFLSYLLSEDVNRNMPENNYMQSVLVDATWPETNGYAHHTDEPELNAEITTQRIGQDMDGWLNAWQEATQ